jgi:uncharacterized membrane protein YqjE
MDPTPSRSTGFVGSLQALGESLLGTVQDRIQLVSIELQEEKLRLIRTFVWVSAVAFLGMMTVAFASATLVYFFWETARLAVLSILTALSGVAFLLVILALRRHLARQPRPFAATLLELQEDRACFRTKS